MAERVDEWLEQRRYEKRQKYSGLRKFIYSLGSGLFGGASDVQNVRHTKAVCAYRKLKEKGITDDEIWSAETPNQLSAEKRQIANQVLPEYE